MTQTTQKQQMTAEKQEPVKTYQSYTDKYFLRTKQILKAENINPIVRSQVFARKNIDSLTGVNEGLAFIKSEAPNIKVYSLRDGQSYTPEEPIMKLEGRVQDFVDLETVYLGIMSGKLTGPLDFKDIREKARAIRQAAGNKVLSYFGARHFGYWDDVNIATICQEEGWDSCSTDVGAEAWNQKGGGTTPHAAFLAMKAYMQENNIQGNPTVEFMKLFDKNIDPNVARIVLGCTFNRELSDVIETVKVLPNLAGTRIDTCGENYTEGIKDITLPDFPKLDVNSKYLTGRGVTIASVWGLRQGLDNAGLGNLSLIVSSGFNELKTPAFMKADKKYQEMYDKPLFDVIGSGSVARPIMTTSDICAYFSEKDNIWKPLSKVGRAELPSNRLEEVK